VILLDTDVLAATAQAYGAAIATRDLRDFAGRGMYVLNPRSGEEA
jgi:hypothetical protein